MFTWSITTDQYTLDDAGSPRSWRTPDGGGSGLAPHSTAGRGAWARGSAVAPRAAARWLGVATPLGRPGGRLHRRGRYDSACSVPVSHVQ